MYSAPMIARANDFSVRLRVATNIRPRGCSIEAQVATKAPGVIHMLYHLHGENDIEPFAGSQLLDGGDAIVDIQRLGAGVNRGSLDVLLRRICPQNRRAKPGHGLRQQAAAAADVEEAQTRKGQALKRIARIAGGDLFAYVFDPQRVEPVQKRETAGGVPPFGGKGRELLHFGRLDADRHRGSGPERSFANQWSRGCIPQNRPV